MLSLAKHSLKVQDYPAAAEATLRALQEVIDAASASEGFHFHDDFPNEGWRKRIEWIRKTGLIFEDAVQRFVDTLVIVCTMKDVRSIEERMAELENFMEKGAHESKSE